MKKFKKMYFEYSEGYALVEVMEDGKDKFLFYGDYYHDKIEEFINGFLWGLHYAGINYEIEEVDMDEELDMYDYFD